MTGSARRLVVVGGGMVAHRLVEAMMARLGDGQGVGQGVGPGNGQGDWHVTLLTEEPHAPYDRVHLTSWFTDPDPAALALGDPALWADPRVTLRCSEQVIALDRAARVVTTASGQAYSYDALVLATGSSPFVPPVDGASLPGCFVYRTIDDVAALQDYVTALDPVDGAGVRGAGVRGAVVGGGLLGLEAAGALTAMNVQTHVVEFAPRLMPLQVDEGGGEALRRLVQGLGVQLHTGTATARVLPATTGERAGHVERMEFAGPDTEGPEAAGLDVDVVVFAAGVRPRDELARAAGLPIGPRGGVVVDDTCRTEDPAVWAIGEVACIRGRTLGLVAPGYAMAEIVVDRLLGGAATFPGADLSTKLKLLGVDVASFGDAFGATDGALAVVYADPIAGVYKKLVVSDDARTLLGGVLVGDASTYASLRPMLGRELGADPATWLLPEGDGTGTGSAAARGGAALPDDAAVCSCNAVTAGTIRDAVRCDGCTDLPSVKTCTRAGTSCGSCLPLVKQLVTAELNAAGVEVSTALCEHFDVTRAQLFDIVRVSGITTFTDLVTRHGRGRGCDICKPVVASILASLYAGHVLDGEHATLQDTNDHVMANIQKDGTYSVVPRIPGGEVTPDGLIAIGAVAKEFDLYTKITGGQRIDLFGARIEQLPAIWSRLVDAGFESGHAYGKALRTVKSCVGSTWCRYGVQDSVALAVALELRYRGLRSPHKLKLGVSGCARECAEARGKDVGVIATDAGWNLYVGGNGGFTPRHARLLAEDLDTATLVRTIDRFLMYYVRTADRLQRTATWLEGIEGGLEHVRAVILEDSLGIAGDLDAAMAGHVDGYVDEWAATLADPEKLRRFAAFVNAPDAADPDLTDDTAYVLDRGQRRPATPAERGHTGETRVRDDEDHRHLTRGATDGAVLIAGPRLEVTPR